MEQESRINYYILFEDYTQGLMLQQLLREDGITSRIAPAPHSIQGKLGCGMSLLIRQEELEKVRACIERNQAEYYDIVPLPCQIRPDRNRFC